MGFILGIDTGGTYTDAVILDEKTDCIRSKKKTFTTPEDLSIGIDNAVCCMDRSCFDDITEVHLSTTLVTNRVLENRFPGTTLITVGRIPEHTYPCGEILNLYAANDTKDSELEDILSYIDPGIYYSSKVILVSVSNDLDRKLEERICSFLSKKHGNVVSVHSVCGDSDYYTRTVTAVLNESLIPNVKALFASIEKVFKKRGINAPLYIMCGNGRLVDCDTATKMPLLSLMSGPGASVVGSLGMTDEKHYLLIDMGGTSADVTRIINRNLDINHITDINDYPVHVDSLNIRSFPIGGDSHIHFNSMGKLFAGPDKVIPLCVAGKRWPNLLKELKTYKKPKGYEMLTVYSTDCFCAGPSRVYSNLRNEDRRLVELVSKSPHSLFYLSDHFKIDADSLHLPQLVQSGVLRRISFTPTDVLHVTGEYTEWDSDIAMTGAEILADEGGMTVPEFCSMCKTEVTGQLVWFCMQSIANFEHQSFDFRESRSTQYIISSYLEGNNEYLDVDFNITKPIVAVGAPSGCWMEDVAAKLGTKFILPENHEVANAIGAALAHHDAEMENML